ncbi:DUF924 family protein [Hydrogenovibrio kuenenii]|uniref:DUF924 family protein n=1 Tax=Hydrogenovibrio kuenenii TaxID=63658 RepID=UPI000465F7BC|nr:DUF924 family protein [Hydrogenovibrio kuenenii]
MNRAEEILSFWFSDRIKPLWFNSTAELDQEIRDKYQTLWQQAQKGLLDDWLNEPKSALALIILLDQMPLNMFRGLPESFQTEQQAVKATYVAIEKGFLEQLPKSQQAFLLMPLMHSENLKDQQKSVGLFEHYGLTANLNFARHHQKLVERFGRFPHRNSILNRVSTSEEEAYLNSDSAFKG